MKQEIRKTLFKDFDLLEEGIIHLSGEICVENISVVVEKILKINAFNSKNEITLIVNSLGGDFHNAFELIDIMSIIPNKIKTIGLGSISSASLLIFMAGDERLISHNSTVLSHSFSWYKVGKFHELVSIRKQEDFLYKQMVNHYKHYTKLSENIIKSKLLSKTDTWLSPKEAVKYHLADKVIYKLK